ncbi:MAG: NUDIX hydrolase, partial [Thermomicrobiales bacterium]
MEPRKININTQPDFAQNPGELFDVVHADGTPTGRTKPRAAVHHDGDWHRALHLWVAGIAENGQPFLMFQQRSPAKDTWPGRFDATVGGHFGAGETLADAFREVHEEIGIHPDPEAITTLGVRICANESERGVLDREVQDVLLLRDDRPLTAYHPNPAEVAALVRFPLPALLDFLVEESERIEGETMPAGESPRHTAVQRGQFVPNVDRYFYRVAIAATAVLRGDRHVAV